MTRFVEKMGMYCNICLFCVRAGEMIVIVIGKERERVEPDRGVRNAARCVLNSTTGLRM